MVCFFFFFPSSISVVPAFSLVLLVSYPILTFLSNLLTLIHPPARPSSPTLRLVSTQQASVSSIPLLLFTTAFGFKQIWDKDKVMTSVLAASPPLYGIFGFVYLHQVGYSLYLYTIPVYVTLCLTILGSIRFSKVFRLRSRLFILGYGVGVPVLLALLNVYLTLSVPQFLLNGETAKVFFVLIIHPIVSACLTLIALSVGARLYGTEHLTNTYFFFVLMHSPLALFGRILLFNIDDRNSQIVSIILLALIELFLHVSLPLRRYTLHYLISFDHTRAYDKMESYRKNPFYAHIFYTRMHIELWSLFAAGVTSLFIQFTRRDEVLLVDTLVPLAVQLFAELGADAASITIDRLYHERNDTSVWAHHKGYFFGSFSLALLSMGYLAQSSILFSDTAS